jgi:hypothetical protein
MKEIIQYLIINLNEADSMLSDLKYQNTESLVAQSFIISNVELINQNNEIVAFCLKTNSEVEDQEFKNKLRDGIPYYNINLNSKNQLFFNDDKGNEIKGHVKEFTKRLKKSFPKLKLESDILIESLCEEVNFKTKKIDDLNDNLDKLTRTIENNDKELDEKKISISQIEDYVKDQISYQLDKSRFKKKIIKSGTNYLSSNPLSYNSDVFYGRSENDKYSKTLFIENSKIRRFICINKNEWYLKIKCYTYYADDGSIRLSEVKFAKYNVLSNEFEPISEATKIDFKVWIELDK